jgi:hypothetical protein
VTPALWLAMLVFGAHPEWKSPSCQPWPPGLVWAGGIVYDVYGCGYPSSNGHCTIERQMQPQGCFENPSQQLTFAVGESASMETETNVFDTYKRSPSDEDVHMKDMETAQKALKTKH